VFVTLLAAANSGYSIRDTGQEAPNVSVVESTSAFLYVERTISVVAYRHPPT
jgi:hypothetical protein